MVHAIEALSRLESWLVSYRSELYELLEVEESIQRVEQIAKTLRAADDWLTEWKAENPSLVTWFEEPNEANRRGVISLCLDKEKSQERLGRNRWRSKLRSIEKCSVGVWRCEEKVMRDHEKMLWKIPDPPPIDESDYEFAMQSRLQVLSKWLDWHGDLSCLRRIVERIQKWEELGTDGTDYHSPIRESYGHRIGGRLTDEHLDLISAIGSLATLISEANHYHEYELLGIIASDLGAYRFDYLADLKFEYDNELRNPLKSIEPRRIEKKLRCGSCCESYPWNGEYPYRCPKCEADKRERDNVTVSKSCDVEQHEAVEDGLYRSKKLFVWRGVPYKWVTDTMMDALELLFKRHPEKVSPKEMESKLGSIPLDGFMRVFRIERDGKWGVHDVSKIVKGRKPSGWYLIDEIPSKVDRS